MVLPGGVVCSRGCVAIAGCGVAGCGGGLIRGRVGSNAVGGIRPIRMSKVPMWEL